VLANTENVVLTVHYNIQPWVGMLTWTPKIGGWGPMGEFGYWKRMKGGVSKAFSFPPLKAKKAAV
jgi:signal peptidase complex subunit 3